MTRPVHEFHSTRGAYDDCQCNEEIKTGDFLLIKSEGVIGVAGCWPWAITEAYGQLHVLTDPENDPQGKAARAEAREQGLFDLIADQAAAAS